jgi:hypothetical protein
MAIDLEFVRSRLPIVLVKKIFRGSYYTAPCGCAEAALYCNDFFA